MAVSVQLFGGCIRDHGVEGEFGSPFTWSCPFTVDPERPWVAILCGVTEPPSQGTLLRGAEALSALGFKTVRYMRVGRGWIERDLIAFLDRRR